jgi:hypothetical protein
MLGQYQSEAMFSSFWSHNAALAPTLKVNVTAVTSRLILRYLLKTDNRF